MLSLAGDRRSRHRVAALLELANRLLDSLADDHRLPRVEVKTDLILPGASPDSSTFMAVAPQVPRFS